MDRQEQIQNLAKIARISVSYAEDLYDSFFPKPVVPQYVADWYEEIKGEFYLNLHYLAWDIFESLDENACVPEKALDDDFTRWYRKNKNAIQIIVNMHQFGYEVEKEPKYRIKMKAARYNGFPQFLCEEDRGIFWGSVFDCRKTKFTRKELEANGFGWVFSCEGVEVKEVTDEIY